MSHSQFGSARFGRFWFGVGLCGLCALDIFFLLYLPFLFVRSMFDYSFCSNFKQLELDLESILQVLQIRIDKFNKF